GAGAPLEQAVEESKDALLDALAEEARLRNLAEALRQRRDDLDGRRRRLEDEQRALGERLHANARASEGARAAIGRLQGERVRLAQVVVPDTAAAIDAVDWLAKTSGGSATVLPREAERRAAVIVPPGPRLVDRIDVEPQYWALVEALLGHVLLAADLDEALKLWRGADHPVT